MVDYKFSYTQELSPDSNYLEQITELDLLYMPNPWSRKTWKNFKSKREDFFYFIKNSEDLILGFAMCHFNHLMEETHLLKICVIPKLRGSGLSSKFFQFIASHQGAHGSIKCFLEVAIQNKGAIEFYNKLGFTKLVVKKSFYSDGSDALALLLEYNKTCQIK